MKKHEDNQVDGKPIRWVVVVDKVQKLPQHRWPRPFENDIALDAVKLSNDHSWKGEFIAKRVGRIPAGFHAECLFPADP